MSRIYTYNELKESKIIYDRKPPAFGVIITFLTLFLLVAALIWAGFSTKTYVVKASGLVVSDSKTNIMNKVSASIDEIYVVEGQSVKNGDELIKFNSFQVELQIAQIESMVSFYQSKVDITEKLILFVNNFTLNLPDARINPFDNTDTSEMKAYSDAQTFIDYIVGQENTAQSETPPREYTQEECDNIKTQFLSQQYGTLDEYKANLIQQTSQAEMYINSLAEYTVRAEQDGIVHLSAGITVGTVLQAGSLLGSISGESTDSLYFESVISASEKSKVKVGDFVEISVSGAMQSEFGVLRGEVAAIDTDSTQTENGQVFYKVKIKPHSTEMKDKKGNTVTLETGMIGESRITYDETTYLKWVIEQIGIKFQ